MTGTTHSACTSRVGSGHEGLHGQMNQNQVIYNILLVDFQIKAPLTNSSHIWSVIWLSGLGSTTISVSFLNHTLG